MVNNVTESCLICFAKAPVKGSAKTRLAADIGIDAAHAVYLHLLERSAACISAWPFEKIICYTGDYASFQQSCLGSFPHYEQSEGDLGTRLWHGAKDRLAEQPVILIGTDCPQIHCDLLLAIHQALQDHDVVFGPASDGGYWALGLASADAAQTCLASDLPWSQAELRQETQARLDQVGLRHCCTQLLNDIDSLADLEQAQHAGFPQISDLADPD